MEDAMKNILIVDNDLGFLVWLGSILTAADYQPWPACSISDALDLVRRKLAVQLDLLIVNPTVPGVSKLNAHLRRTQTHLKVMGLGRQDDASLPGADAWRLKPGPTDDSARQEWVRAVDSLSVQDRSVA